MATSIELENVGRERYSVKDVKAKVEVDLISKDSAKTEVDDKDFYVCVNRNVESKFIKADESSEDKIDQFIVKHHETITVVQGLANTKLTNPDNWIIKIKRQLSETTFFKGKEIIDKISQRQENLERNKDSPIVKVAIAKELLKRSKEEQKIESILNVNQEPLDDNQNSIEKEKENRTPEENNHFAASTTASESSSPDTSKDEQGDVHDITVKVDVETIKPTENLKITTLEKEVKNGAEIELLKREVVSNFGPSNSKLNKIEERYLESPTTKEIPNDGTSATDKNDVEVEILPSPIKEIPSQAEDHLSSSENPGNAKKLEEDAIGEGRSGGSKGSLSKVVSGSQATLSPSIGNPKNENESEKHADSRVKSGGSLRSQPASLKEGSIGHGKSGGSQGSGQNESQTNENKNDVEVEIHDIKETLKINDVEAKVENGTTNQPEKTSLKSEKYEAKSTVGLPTTKIINEKASSSKYGPWTRTMELLLKRKEFASDPNELMKIERALEGDLFKIYVKEDPEAGAENGTTNQPEKTSLKSEKSEAKLNEELPIRKIERAINAERPSIYVNEDPEAGAEAAKHRVREVFHMDVAELIIERNA